MEETDEGDKNQLKLDQERKIFMERRELPDNFAEEVMENEFAIEEGNFTIENVD